MSFTTPTATGNGLQYWRELKPGIVRKLGANEGSIGKFTDLAIGSNGGKRRESKMLKVRDLMTCNPDTVNPDTPLRDVLQRMKIEDCRQLPVVENGELVGIITVTDFLNHFTAKEPHSTAS